MVGERTGRQTLGTASSHRRRLSNITNLINGGSWSNENDLVKNTCGSTELQLQQEIKRLEQINIEKDLVIAEKEHEIESQKSFMHKMQRDFYANIYKRSQQNEDIIGFNTRLSKELSTVREQLKMLHHEYTQMTIVYKVNESELQTRLAEAQEQLRRVCEEKEKASHEPLNSDGVPPTVVRRTRNSSARRHSMTLGDIWNPSTNTHSMSSLDTSAVTTRGGVRQKAGTLPQKDTSVKLKIRQHDCASVPIIVPACTTKRYNNRYGHLYNLEPMQEVEESEALSSSNSTSRLPRGNPCLESLSSEVVERESSANYESFSEGQRAGEITSTSECNEARVTHSSEPRLSVKVSKNHCEKNPPPARPNTPQRRSASQPTTPRNRSEIQVALQPELLLGGENCKQPRFMTTVIL
uniref:Shugoshin C-terminal domain-containing protein n=1 Tax=Physcomitrium patens TaxID=3218 RepID=A0A7I4FGF8_PHYPA